MLGTVALFSAWFISRLLPSPTPIKEVVPEITTTFPKITPIVVATASAKKQINTSAPTTPPSPSSNYGVPILMYHYVGNNPNPADRQRDILSITTDKLDTQFNWLSQNGYTPITLDTLYGIFNSKEKINKPIVLTFDDGYVDFYFNAYPTLRKYNFRAVSFIPTGLMGTSYYMSWDQIKEIKNSGLVSFQAHTVTHSYLPNLPYSQIQSELADSKKTLEQQLGTHVNFIAYPYGASDASVWRAAAAAGFVGGVGTWYGKTTGPGINLPRIRIAGTISLGEFIQKIER